MSDQETFLNPYVIQADKFAEALCHLARVSVKLENDRAVLSKEEKEDIFARVTEKVCAECENRELCLGEHRVYTYQMVCEVLGIVEEYGAELNVEFKRKMQKACVRAPRFLRETLEACEEIKKELLWNNKMVHNREGYAKQMNRFARILSEMTRDLDVGIFEDEHLKKKIKAFLKKSKIKMISSIFYITPQGKYEIHLTLKAAKGHIVPVKELAFQIGKLVGRTMIPKQGERPFLGDEYCTIACVEGAQYHILHGIAKVGKNLETVSGDTFLMTDLPGGKMGAALSDGMGAGESAFRESTMVVEMLEELLNAGFDARLAVEIMNTVLATGREEIRFSTVDISLFDLYSGECEFVKAGAAATYIRHGDQVIPIHSTTLPIGVLTDIEVETTTRKLESGDFVVMVTDGITDALPPGKQDEMMGQFLMEIQTENPGEMANEILGKVMGRWEGMPMDDMTVLVVGIWAL